MKNTDVKQTAVMRATNLLNAVNAAYVVEYGGRTYKSTAPINGAVEPEKKLRISPLMKYDYTTKLDAAAAGDVVVIDGVTGGKKEEDRLQSAVLTYGVRTRGRGGVMTHRTNHGRSLEVLIVNDKRD